MMNLDPFSEPIKTNIAYSYRFRRQAYLPAFRHITAPYGRMHPI
jgi:hypothetical protein